MNRMPAIAAGISPRLGTLRKLWASTSGPIPPNRPQIIMLEAVIKEFKSQLAKQDVRIIQLHGNASHNEPRLEALGNFLLALEGISREQTQTEEKQRKYAD